MVSFRIKWKFDDRSSRVVYCRANFGDMKIELWMDLERLVGIVVDLTDKLVYNNSLKWPVPNENGNLTVRNMISSRRSCVHVDSGCM